MAPAQVCFGDLTNVIARINDIGVTWVNGNVATFSTADFMPEFLRGQGIVKSTGYGNSRIILLCAVQAVRELIVKCKAVELRGGLIELAAPCTTGIEGYAGTTVVALDHQVGVVWVDPEYVGIAMGYRDAGKTFAPINGLHKADVEVVHCIFVLGVGIYARVVPGALANAVIATDFGETFTTVFRAIQTTFGFFLGFHLYPNPGGLYRRNGDANPANQTCG